MQKRIYITLTAILLATVFTQAQHQKLQNLPYADYKIFHLGFVVGMHAQDLQLTQSGVVQEDGEAWFSEIPDYSPGFSVGLITDLYLTHHLNLRVIPTLHLGSKNITFKEQTSGEEFKSNIKNNYITVPVQVKINAGRINNYRPYIVAGGYGSIEIAPRKDRPVLLKPFDYGIEFGIGCDFYLPYFKLSPELKIGFGLIDILQTDRSDLTNQELIKYPQSLSKAKQRLIVLSFNFE